MPPLSKNNIWVALRKVCNKNNPHIRWLSVLFKINSNLQKKLVVPPQACSFWILKLCKQEQCKDRNTKSTKQELSIHQMIVDTFQNYFTLDKIAKFSEALLFLAVLENLNSLSKSNIKIEIWKVWNRNYSYIGILSVLFKIISHLTKLQNSLKLWCSCRSWKLELCTQKQHKERIMKNAQLLELSNMKPYQNCL